MTDGDLDRTLAQALDVDPSPEFLARVRLRIAAEPEPARWNWKLAAVALATPAVIAVAVVVAWQWPQPAAPIEWSVRVGPAPPIVYAPSPAQAAPTVAAPVVTNTAVRSRPRPIGERPKEPAVLIDADDARGVALLARTARSGRLAGARLFAEDKPGTTPSQIDIPPMVIEPLPQIARLE